MMIFSFIVLMVFGSEFKEIAAIVRSRDASTSFENIHDMLVKHETTLMRADTTIAAPVITAIVTQSSQRTNTYRGSRSNNSN